jgi:hypothetical protein
LADGETSTGDPGVAPGQQVPMSRLTALTPGNAIGAAWAWYATGDARRQLKDGRLVELSLRPPPRSASWRGVRIVLNRRKLTCLEQSVVRQRWYGARGWPRDLVIGIAKRDHDFVMHAWLEGDSEGRHDTFAQLFRYRASPIDYLSD